MAKTTPRSLRNLISASALTGAFALSTVFSVTVTRGADGIETLWLATGFMTAGLLILDRAWGVGLAIVGYLINVGVNLLAGDPTGPAFVLPAVSVVEAVACVMLAKLACGPAVRLVNLERIARLLFMAIAPAAATGALLAANVWTLFGRDFDSTLTGWFFADMLGMALVLSGVLMVRQNRTLFHRPPLERLAIYVAMAVITVLAFSASKFPLQLLLFPVATLAAFRLGPRGAVFGTLVMAMVSLACMVSRPVSELNSAWTMPERIRLLQFLVGLVFFTSLLTAMALTRQARLQAMWMCRSRMARKAQARAVVAGRAKADFLATMSHEIRTPMNSIIGFAQVLSKREDLPEVARRQINLIERSGASLLTVVNDVLDFSKMEAGEVEFVLKPCSPRAIAQDALAIVGETARRKNLALDMTVAGSADRAVMIDDVRVRQVLLNLLANAIKFTETGRVRVDVQARDGAELDLVRYTVTDTGIGIPEEKIGRLFQRFSQVDVSTTRAATGTGLGLAICKGLVERMGGRIGVESGEIGSVFWFEIPAQRALVEPPVAPKPEAAATHAARGARILLVDDHDMNRELGVTVLGLLGCQVETATNGREAVAAAVTGGYDLILMDVHMPLMDGLEATRILRGMGGNIAATPIVGMSADVMPEMNERCLKAGMVDTLGKPIQISAMHAMIAKWTGAFDNQDAQAA